MIHITNINIQGSKSFWFCSKMENSKMTTFGDVYNYLLNEYNEHSIIPFLQNNWTGTEKQETLYRLFCMLGLNKDFKHYTIYNKTFNYETEYNEHISLSSWMQSCVKDNRNYSDLTLIDEERQTIIASTSKNSLNMGIDEYDILKIESTWNRNHKSKYPNLKIAIVTPCIHNFQQKVNRASHTTQSKKIINNECDNITCVVYDHHDLDTWFQSFKRCFNNVAIKDIDTYLFETNKTSIQTQFHQDIYIERFVRIKDKHRYICNGCHARTGKMYMVALSIFEDGKHREEANYLIISLKYNETKKQFEDLFLESLEFHDYNFITLTSEYTNKTPNIGTKNVFFASKAYLDKKVHDGKVIEWLQNIHINMLFIDEVDDGGCTELARKVYNVYAKEANNIVFTTATYTKPVNVFDIHPDAMILWDLEDIYLCKNLDISLSIDDDISIKRLCEKYPNDTYIINKYINIYGKEKVRDTYTSFPNINLITSTMDKDFQDLLQDISFDTDNGFSIGSAFLIKKNKFLKPDAVARIIEMMFGKLTITERNNKKLVSYSSNNNIIQRIKNIQLLNKSRTEDDTPLSYLCFLPCGIGKPIDQVSKAFEDLLQKCHILELYDVVSINSKIKGNPKDIISSAMNKLKESRKNEPSKAKKGLIILAAKQCTTGVSLPHCDVIFHLNDFHSSDLLYQMNNRSATKDVDKTCCFVVDLNVHRAITTMISLADKIYPKLTTKEGLKRLVEQKIVMFNSDEWLVDDNNNQHDGVFHINHRKFDKFICNVYEKYRQNPSVSINYLLNDIIFDKDDLGIDYEYYASFLECKKAKTTKVENLQQEENVVLKEQEGECKGNLGYEMITEFDDTYISEEQAGRQPDNIQDVNQDIEKDKLKLFSSVIRKIAVMMSFLSIKHKDLVTFEDMFKSLSENDKLIIENQLRLSDINNLPDNFMNRIMETFQNTIKNNTEFNNKVKRIKELICEAKGDYQKLQDLVYKFLIPTEKEKKDNAEVTTPPSLVKEKYDCLQKYANEVFMKPTKLFDPCVGKGVYVVEAFRRFDEGLKDFLEDKEERHKFILEECIYFSDKNELNVFITKLLLDPEDKYKLNYHIGDTLKLNIKEKWGLNGFELVVGNPPYNSSGNTGTGNTIWQHFVTKAVDNWLLKDGYLVYVHPPGWRKPESEKSKYNGLFKLLTHQNHMLYLEIHSARDGLKTFHCGTRYDWYVLRKEVSKEHYTDIIDIDNAGSHLSLNNWKWLPNSNFSLIEELLNNGTPDNSCPVIYSRSSYGCDKSHVKSQCNSEFLYPLIHATNKTGVRYLYSNCNDKGHFNISKIIFGQTGISDVIIDLDGIYGMTDNAIGICVSSHEEASNLRNALMSSSFQDVLTSCMFGNFRIDWRLFQMFRKDFWTKFV